MRIYYVLMTTVLFVSVLGLLTSCSSQLSTATISSDQGEVVFDLELAQTAQEQQQGLMFRESLAQDEGMLFVFSDEKERAFWMKNVQFPVDMLFINQDGSITNIAHAIPCRKDPCEIYRSIGPAAFVLEVNNITKEKGIAVGDRVEFS